jgi:hypothetical protein
MFRDARSCLLLIALPFCCFSIFPRKAAAQDPIRVQSNEVLVPTVVFDKELYAQLNKMKPHHRDSYGHLVEKDAKLWENIAVKGLTEKDFHLFEDGKEQKIQRVKLEAPAFRVVQDSLGKHPEIVGSGGGLWAYPDLPKTDPSVWLAWPQYVLAYTPPNSPPGSCHQIRVEVSRANLTVWTRSEYCNTAHPASDPLSGTEFGKKMEAAANSGRQSDLDLQLKVATFADNAYAARVYVSMSFPWQALAHEFRDGTLYATIASLILVYGKDGTLAARYSDFACCDYGNDKKLGGTDQATEAPPAGDKARLPDRYETQLALPPGEYEIRAVLSDGVHLGLQKIPLTVEHFDASEVWISDVVLSRRVRKVSADETEAAAQVADSYTALISKGVEYSATASTQFWPEDTLFAYVEINDPLGAGTGSTKLHLNMRILVANSGAVMETFEPVDTTTYRKGGSALIAVGRGVRLNHLAPGEYRMEIQASDAEGKSTAWKSADFRVMEASPLEMK